MRAIVATIYLLIGASLGAPSPRVIGGEDVLSDKFPYQISIQSTLFDNQHLCGGAIISPTWIITAAHCVGISLLVSRVVAGAYNLSVSDDSTGLQINYIDLYSVIKHTDYSEIKNDIALLKMTQPFVFNEYVQPLPISKVPCVALDETTTFSGWGAQGDYSVESVLQTTNMTIIPFDECYSIIQSVYGSNLPLQRELHICATSTASPCILDGGGPLVQDNRLIGLLTWLPATCLGSTIPAIFTNTGYFKDFIKLYVDDLPSL